MAQSLAVKYRPKVFSELLGQPIVAKILQRQIETHNIAHAYLFAGNSGCGKTSCARLFANAINNGIGTPIEIDGASNNGVANVRAILESANQRALSGEYKIFIIDECHMISTEGWNAFLKGIEEPAEYTIFMFCTTEPEKIPATILNRVQKYNIVKIATNTIKDRLAYICQQEGFTNYEAAIDLISKASDGCMRDAIQSLDLCASLSKELTLDNTRAILGNISYETMFKLTWALQTKDEGAIISIINNMYDNGQDLKTFVNSYLTFLLDLDNYAIFQNIELTSIPGYLATSENPVVQQTLKIDSPKAWLGKVVDMLLDLKLQIKYDTSLRNTIEAYLLRICRSI